MLPASVSSILLIFWGTIALWVGITFINGTLWVGRLAGVYELIPQAFWRMMLILPVMGVGHLCFSLAMKVNPSVASPAGIVFTVLPPAIYALWLLQAWPSPRVVVYVVVILLFALLLGVELGKLK